MKASKHALPDIVSAEQWQAAAQQFLAKEKALTRARDALNAERRRLPMVKIEKAYTFDGPSGHVSLLDLFEGRRQLIVYHFMFAPDWSQGCPGCSWVVEAMPHLAHLQARDTSLVLISIGPLEKLEGYKQRMGWDLPWYSSLGSSFNADFGVTTEKGEKHGVSVLLRDGGDIYRTYFTGARGVEQLGSHWSYLDLTPLGRQENWEDSPKGWPQTEPYTWLRRHDEYGD